MLVLKHCINTGRKSLYLLCKVPEVPRKFWAVAATHLLTQGPRTATSFKEHFMLSEKAESLKKITTIIDIYTPAHMQ